MPRIALVLGGGGLVGQAFHAGALAALEHDYGWDPRTADVIVGTSAGAISGALLRSGITATDLATHFAEGPSAPEVLRGAPRPHFAPFDWTESMLQLPNPTLVARFLRLPWWRHPLSALLTMMRDGDNDLLSHLAFLDTITGGAWPKGRLILTAIRQGDGRRVTFDNHDAREAPLSSAVAASCAVPGYFQPVLINGQRYLDGGLQSATNADLVKDESFDATILISPLSTSARVPVTSIDGFTRRVATRQVRAEKRTLAARGHNVVVVEPGKRSIEVMGSDMMSSAACAGTTREAFLELGRQATLHAPLRDALGSAARRSQTA